MENENKNSGAKPEIDTEKVYYFSESGSIWSPVHVIGTVTGTDGGILRYMLGSFDGTDVVEVPAEWFDANKDALEFVEGWVPNGKPTLKTKEQAEVSHAQNPEHVNHPLDMALAGEALKGIMEDPREDTEPTPDEDAREQEIIAKIEGLKAGLSGSDKIALWSYGIALYPHEQASARDKMSSVLANDHERLYRAEEFYRELSKLREARRKR